MGQRSENILFGYKYNIIPKGKGQIHGVGNWMILKNRFNLRLRGRVGAQIENQVSLL